MLVMLSYAVRSQSGLRKCALWWTMQTATKWSEPTFALSQAWWRRNCYLADFYEYGGQQTRQTEPHYHQMVKSLGDNLTQGMKKMNNLNQTPAVISAAMVASMGDLKAALVGAIGSTQSRGVGQFQPCAQQASQPLQQLPNFSSRNNHKGHATLSNSPPSSAEFFERDEIGHFARECPRRARSEHLKWAQMESQR